MSLGRAGVGCLPLRTLPSSSSRPLPLGRGNRGPQASSSGRYQDARPSRLAQGIHSTALRGYTRPQHASTINGQQARSRQSLVTVCSGGPSGGLKRRGQVGGGEVSSKPPPHDMTWVISRPPWHCPCACNLLSGQNSVACCHERQLVQCKLVHYLCRLTHLGRRSLWALHSPMLASCCCCRS